jgi:hypothetical protein
MIPAPFAGMRLMISFVKSKQSNPCRAGISVKKYHEGDKKYILVMNVI